jgi:hypothetical protein
MLRGAKSAGTKGVQRAAFDCHGVALAHAGNADDGAGDYFGYWVVAIHNAEVRQGSLVSGRHNFNCFRLKRAVGNRAIMAMANYEETSPFLVKINHRRDATKKGPPSNSKGTSEDGKGQHLKMKAPAKAGSGSMTALAAA